MSTVDLGFDLGTTVTKVSAVADDGRRLLDHSLATAWRETGEGRVDRSPASVVEAVEVLLGRVAADLPPGTTVRSVGFTSMAEAGVLVDAAGREQSPVIAWYDPRGSAQAAALPADLRHAFPARTGLPVSHVASLFKLLHLRDEGLDLRGLQWLSVPEFVVLRLGGRRVAELSLLGRTGLLDVHTDRPWLPALEHLGVGPDLLPEVVAAGTPAGTVRDDHPVIALRGAVLTIAGHDHAVAAAATGCGAPGSALDSFGTAEAWLASASHVPEPAVVRDLALRGISVYPHTVRGPPASSAAHAPGWCSSGCSRSSAPSTTRPARPSTPPPSPSPRRHRRRHRHRVRDGGPRGRHPPRVRGAHPGPRVARRHRRRHRPGPRARRHPARGRRPGRPPRGRRRLDPDAVGARRPPGPRAGRRGLRRRPARHVGRRPVRRLGGPARRHRRPRPPTPAEWFTDHLAPVSQQPTQEATA
ncbi:hypothetical protein G7075_10840 [Phycicoccus sp. HDW14]|uniref:FGGY family carbohydrate kinase n=1 Tax=Phycicoccus sp. HDW14 TaxID=2714941 RepID=UPI001409D44F|nr:FGGY family carbohydrate kinase [Phycicoccus sp. HDW14]QIM21511.1 hypothetical protein G7075_10840 [Phycicoccus sp. HDW14]